MPKLVDHYARKNQLAQATWRVIERDGVAKASVRAIAQEAGVTPGQLRHYFSDHYELLIYAATAIGERLQARLGELLQSELHGVDLAQQLLEQLLPLDETRRLEGQLWLGWLERTHFDQKLRGMRSNAWLGVRSLCRVAYCALYDLPFPQDMTNPLAAPAHEIKVQRLHTFIDGLTLQAVAFPEYLPPQQAQQQLHEFLQEL